MAALEKPGRPLTVEANMGLVRQTAWKFRWALGTVLEEADLLQAGSLGLMRALETYDPELGALSTYAQPWIRVAIQEAISHGRRVVRVPTKLEADMCKRGEPPPLDVLQLDVPLGDRDLLRSDEDPSEPLDDAQRTIILHEALDRLPKRLQGMMRARFFGDLTLQAIADQHDLSRERVRQLVARGVRQMRTYMEAVEMGSMKRRVKKGMERHLRLIKGGKVSFADRFLKTVEGSLERQSAAAMRVTNSRALEREQTVIGPEAYKKLAADLGVDLGKPTLGGCVQARDEYELGDVACCPRCHAKEQTSYVEDPAGYYEVCCTVRAHLCPGEDGPTHGAA